jgi:hypothetical protein
LRNQRQKRTLCSRSWMAAGANPSPYLVGVSVCVHAGRMTASRRSECAASLAARSRLDDLADPLDKDYRSWWPHGAEEYRRQVKALAAWILEVLPTPGGGDRFRRGELAQRFGVHDRMAGDALWWLEDLGLVVHVGWNSPYFRRVSRRH